MEYEGRGTSAATSTRAATSDSITRQINWFESPVDGVAPLCADRKRRAKPVSEQQDEDQHHPQHK